VTYIQTTGYILYYIIKVWRKMLTGRDKKNYRCQRFLSGHVT